MTNMTRGKKSKMHQHTLDVYNPAPGGYYTAAEEHYIQKLSNIELYTKHNTYEEIVVVAKRLAMIPLLTNPQG